MLHWWPLYWCYRTLWQHWKAGVFNPFVVFLSFSHCSNCQLKTGTWTTRPQNSSLCICLCAVLVWHSSLWGTSVKLEKKIKAFLLPIFPPGDSSILSSSHYSSGKVSKLKSKGTGRLTFQVFSSQLHSSWKENDLSEAGSAANQSNFHQWMGLDT